MDKVVIKYDGKIFYTDKEYYDKLGKIGKFYEDKIIFEPEEVLYMLKKGWCVLENIRNFEDFIESFSNIINYKKYFVFEDLRDKGYYLDIFGDFIIVYERGDKKIKRYLVYTLFEYEFIEIEQLLNLISLAREDNLYLVLAIIDYETDIVYYKVQEIFI